MTGKPRKSRPMDANALLAELAGDADYQARKAEFEAGLRDRTEALLRAQQPILSDLAKAGYPVTSVWDFVNKANTYDEALPILLRHFESGGYPERVQEGLGRALAVPSSVKYWDRLKKLWLHARGAGEEDGAAVALAACATTEKLDDLIRFLGVENRGESRLYFVRAILRVGGESGLQVVRSLRSDPVFGPEARALVPHCGDG